MPIKDCISRHTYREYRTWIAWLDEAWNTPNRTDHYLMQIAAEVRRVLSKKPNSIKLKHFKITFSTSGSKKPKVDKETATRWAKARWFGFLGMGRKRDA